MIPIKSKLRIEQGANFSSTISVLGDDGQPFNLTGYTGAAQLRKHYSSSSYHTFTVALGGNTGIVTLSMTPTQTGAINSGIHVFDCEVTSGNTVYRVAEGQVNVSAQVTKS
jgi:hypothetical protein